MRPARRCFSSALCGPLPNGLCQAVWFVVWPPIKQGPDLTLGILGNKSEPDTSRRVVAPPRYALCPTDLPRCLS